MKTLRQIAEAYVRRQQAGRPARAVSPIKTCVGAFVGSLQTQRVLGPSELKPEHIFHWLTEAASVPHRRSGMPRKLLSVHSEISRARAFVATLVAEGVLSKALLDAFPKLRKPAILPRITLKHLEVKKILRHVPTHAPGLHMLRTMMEMAYSTAMRPCELLRLDVTDIDVQSDRGLIRVLGKGDKERMLPIGRHAHRMLCNYIRGVRPMLLRSPEEKALWLSARGTRLKYGRMLALLHQHVAGDHQEKVTWYSFRRACATELARSGANLWAIKVLLGHDHIETVKHYVHFTLDDLKRAHTRCHPRNLCATDSARITP